MWGSTLTCRTLVLEFPAFWFSLAAGSGTSMGVITVTISLPQPAHSSLIICFQYIGTNLNLKEDHSHPTVLFHTPKPCPSSRVTDGIWTRITQSHNLMHSQFCHSHSWKGGNRTHDKQYPLINFAAKEYIYSLLLNWCSANWATFQIIVTIGFEPIPLASTQASYH